MNTKRLLVFGMLGLFMVSMMAGVLGAIGDPSSGGGSSDIDGGEVGRDVGGFFNQIGRGVGGFIEGLGLKGDITTDFLSKLFFAILLGMVIYTVVSTFFSDAGSFAQWGITGAITFISFFGIPASYFEALRVSYGAMGLTILTVIPFLIMVVFTVKVKDLMVARGTWAFYALYYGWLMLAGWWGTVGVAGVSSVPYVLALIGGIIMFWTIPYFRHWNDAGKLGTLEEKAETAIDRNIAVQKLAKKSREGEVEGATS